jgi:AcrR family transcriptional regulator
MARPRTDIEPRVLLAARKRFLQEGVDGASLRHIARDAKTSIGMVYYYFPTKDDLFFAVIEEIYVALLGDLKVALAPDVPVRARVERFYARIGSLSEDELLTVRLVLREALVSSSRLDRIIELFGSGHVPLVLRTVQDGFADGTFDARSSPIVVAISMMALAGPAQLMRRLISAKLPFVRAPEGADFAREAVNVFFQGLGGPQLDSRRHDGDDGER